MWRHRRAWAVVLLFACGAGCTHRNQRLNDQNAIAPALRANATTATLAPGPAADDGLFVGLAISGGGSRSANFSAACMFRLQQLGILQRTDYISSVSGGSLTAAYYCLSADDDGDDGWAPGTVQRKLTHSFASDVVWGTFLPWNLVALSVSDWDRSDVLAGSFEKHLFTSPDGEPQTFADLRPDRPRLLINATDLQSGRRFVFCNETFDALNSDLASYPIAHAVAASAAVPVLMHHVTLRDHSTTFAQYRHLIDGGVTDNLGIRTLAEVYDTQVRAAGAAGGDPYPRGAILIILDAKTQFDASLSDKADIGLIETIATGAGLTSTALINRASSATLAELILRGAPADATAGDLRAQIDRLNESGYLVTSDVRGRPVRVLHLALSRVADVAGELPFASFDDRVNSIATYFDIDPTSAYHLYQAAELLTTRSLAGPLSEIAREVGSAGGAPPDALEPDAPGGR